MDWLLVAVFSKLSEKRTEKRIGQISRRNERKRGGGVPAILETYKYSGDNCFLLQMMIDKIEKCFE